jgi:hypothetical protein
MISDTSESVIIVPVNVSDSKKISSNQNVLVSSENTDKTISANVFSIDNSVYTINDLQYKFVTVISDQSNIELQPGLYVDCEFDTGNKTLFSIISDNLIQFFY